MKKMTLIASLAGNTLEWYDYLLYAYFASILAPLFFPSADPRVSLLLTFAAFAVGFFARPLGAIVLGHIGDTYGRKTTLLISMSLITIATIGIGLLPTYQAIGAAAPIILTLIRCIQGFAVAGEIGTAASFLVEQAPAKRRGIAGSSVLCTAYIGILLGALIAEVTTLIIPTDILHTWGWRIPFLLAAPWGIIGIILRLRIVESDHFKAAQKKPRSGAPIKLLLFKYPRLLLCCIGVIIATAVNEYFLIAYFTTYLTEHGIHLRAAMLINVVSLLFFLCSVPFFGHLSDLYGRKKIFLCGTVSLLVVMFPVFWLLSQQVFFLALVGEIIFALALGSIASVIFTIVAENFATEIRNTAVTFAYNMTFAIFGGTAPFMAVFLVHLTGLSIAPAFYAAAGVIVAIAAVLSLKETYKQPLKSADSLSSPQGEKG